MKAIPFIILIFALFSCKTTKNADAGNPNDTGKAAAIISTDKEMSEMDPAPFEIQSCKIEGNTLMLTVEYSGGCQEHDFQVVGSPNIAKSLPPIRSVRILHNNNGDACRGIIKKDLSFDISALAYKQEEGSVIYLTIEGWNDRVEYTYTVEKK